MSLLHRHQWEITDVQHIPGVMERGGDFKFGGGSWGRAASDSLYGYALISQKCGCGHVRTVKVTGKFEVGL